jgi:DNA polymerase-3 subunit gamma/tau
MHHTTALYRTYRPTTFDHVLDQDHIVSVLKGAIDKGTLPHALLFSGTRGTGKTTLARIFASSIGTNPIDVYEIDAASNRGIDNIRELREAVHTLPYESTHKVYIIDEVHMLTKEAFNAILKTLEEPPAHVIFILATTEEEKLLDTIISRCQVFRMHSPSVAVLQSAVIDIAKQEGLTLEAAAAALVAVAANGSFRDALSILQKVIMASGVAIGTPDEVALIIGAPRVATLETFVRALHAGDAAAAIQAISDALSNQVSPELFLRQSLDILRAVILLRNQVTIDLAHLPDSLCTLARELSAADTPINSAMLARFLRAAEELQYSPIPRLPLELAVVEVCKK